MTLFLHTYCSQCGHDLGPGDEGVSQCRDHTSAEDKMHILRRAQHLSADPVDKLAALYLADERLEFVLDHRAFIHSPKLDAPITRYQLLNQDEDEEFHVLSGDNKSYATKREAIDAAIAATGKKEQT